MEDLRCNAAYHWSESHSLAMQRDLQSVHALRSSLTSTFRTQSHKQHVVYPPMSFIYGSCSIFAMQCKEFAHFAMRGSIHVKGMTWMKTLTGILLLHQVSSQQRKVQQVHTSQVRARPAIFGALASRDATTMMPGGTGLASCRL